MKKQGDTGAPAALAAIERHELECRTEKDNALAEWKEAKRLVVDGDDVSERKERRLHNQYRDALEMWDDATKKLAVFDKGVRPERREGEKILVADAKELFAQYELCVDLALEQCIVADCQSAALCNSPDEFHAAHAENWRSAKASAIDAARRDGAIPAWL